MDGKTPWVVHEAAAATSQTPGMERKSAIDEATVGASRIFMGRASAPPDSCSQIHHHGESETAAYVVRGRVRVYYGEGFRQYVEAGPGDFLFVPAHIHHIEMNPSLDEPMEVILARGPANTVVNIGDPPAHVGHLPAATTA